jgi:hypothetical protein
MPLSIFSTWPSNISTIKIPNCPDAPNYCEMCNELLPDAASRLAHVKDTKHMNCGWDGGCDDYVPLSGFYNHWCENHPKFADGTNWNDHMMAWTDKVRFNEAMLWARERTLRLQAETSDWRRESLEADIEREREKEREKESKGTES